MKTLCSRCIRQDHCCNYLPPPLQHLHGFGYNGIVRIHLSTWLVLQLEGSVHSVPRDVTLPSLDTSRWPRRRSSASTHLCPGHDAGFRWLPRCAESAALPCNLDIPFCGPHHPGRLPCDSHRDERAAGPLGLRHQTTLTFQVLSQTCFGLRIQVGRSSLALTSNGFVPSIMNSPAWQAELASAQRHVIETAGSQGGGLTRILSDTQTFVVPTCQALLRGVSFSTPSSPSTIAFSSWTGHAKARRPRSSAVTPASSKGPRAH